MKKYFLLVALCAMTLLPSLAQEQVSYVEVRGSAEELIDPDMIEVSVSLNEATSKGKISLNVMESQFATALEQAGVDVKECVVLVDQSSKAKNKSNTYQYKNYRVTLRTVQEVSNLFEALEANNVQDVALTKMWNSKSSEIALQLKIKAMENAKNTAEQLAGAYGQKIGKAFQITDQSYFSNDNIVFRGYATTTVQGDGMSKSMPEVQLQQIKINQSVLVRFHLD